VAERELTFEVIPTCTRPHYPPTHAGVGPWHYAVTVSHANSYGATSILMIEYISPQPLTTYASIQQMIRDVAAHSGFDPSHTVVLNLVALGGDATEPAAGPATIDAEGRTGSGAVVGTGEASGATQGAHG
jgi:hypothetical protein